MKRKSRQSHNMPSDSDAVTVARGLASSYLYRASVNARKLLKHDNSTEAETLHGFRVSIRRLRGVLKAYKRAFPAVSKSARANLRGIAKATNRARDLEVIISWVQSTKNSIDSADHKAWNRIIDQLKEAFFSELQRVKDKKLQLFQSSNRTMAKDLTKTRQAKSKYGHESFSKATHDMLANLINRLKVQVECARHCLDPQLLHQIRVTTKRARYLLEPLTDLEDATEIVEHLKELQDELGAIQDRQVLIAFLIESLAYSKENPLLSKEHRGERRVGLKLLEIASKEQSKRIGALNDAWFEQHMLPVILKLEALTSQLASVPVE